MRDASILGCIAVSVACSRPAPSGSSAPPPASTHAEVAAVPTSTLDAAGSPIRLVSFHPDGRRVAVVADDGSIEIRDARNGNLRAALRSLAITADAARERSNVPLALGWAAGGDALGVLYSDRASYVTPTFPETVRTFRGTPSVVGATVALFVGGGEHVVTLDETTSSLTRHDATTGEVLASSESRPAEGDEGPEWLERSSTLLLTVSNRMVHLRDALTLERTRSWLRLPQGRHGGAYAASPDGKSLMLSGSGSQQRIDVASGKVTFEHRSRPPRRGAGHSHLETVSRFGADDRHVVVLHTWAGALASDFTLDVVDTTDGKVVRIDGNAPGDWSAPVLSPDGAQVCITRNRTTCRCWDAASAKPLGERPSEGSTCEEPTGVVSSDGTLRALVRRGGLSVRDATTDAVLWRLPSR